MTYDINFGHVSVGQMKMRRSATPVKRRFCNIKFIRSFVRSFVLTVEHIFVSPYLAYYVLHVGRLQL